MSASNGRFSRYTNIITSFDEIRDVIGEPAPSALAKVTDRLDAACQAFIAQSPFVVMASTSVEGLLDLSPRGDPAGFVHVFDDKHLAIPDRAGNRRADTMQNVLQNPWVGLFFMIPGKAATLRVSGEARIVRDDAVRVAMAGNDGMPNLAFVVYVERAYMHCPKALVESFG